ncbi:MAG: hypothetical protein ACOX4P_06710 [Anaerovoracaceae bacterium]
MKFELNLLQNSHDYVNSSFELYKVANEYGNHDEQTTLFENKVKWKLAFVTMVQAVELLLKESLYRVHPSLIFENIDSVKEGERNTISFQQSLNRVCNFTSYIIEAETKLFLVKCSKMRNDFIHYQVKIQSEQIKSKYSKLYKFYKELHEALIGETIKFYKKSYNDTEFEVLEYDKNWTVFRGVDIKKEEVDDYIKEIEDNKRFKYCVDSNGRKIERIKYGDEIKYIEGSGRRLEMCGGCLAKIGEYHLDNCDQEICPFCLRQLVTCGCVVEMQTE